MPKKRRNNSSTSGLSAKMLSTEPQPRIRCKSCFMCNLLWVSTLCDSISGMCDTVLLSNKMRGQMNAAKYASNGWMDGCVGADERLLLTHKRRISWANYCTHKWIRNWKHVEPSSFGSLSASYRCSFAPGGIDAPETRTRLGISVFNALALIHTLSHASHVYGQNANCDALNTIKWISSYRRHSTQRTFTSSSSSFSLRFFSIRFGFILCWIKSFD